MILKNTNDDTCLSDSPVDGWVEITQSEFEAIIASRTPAQVPIIPPISPRQIRMALSRAGLREYVEAAVSAGDQDLKDWYEFSTAFERDNSQVIGMGLALGQTNEQLDALWALGASL